MREDRQRVARPSPHRDPHGGRRGRAGGARRGRPRARRGARHPRRAERVVGAAARAGRRGAGVRRARAGATPARYAGRLDPADRRAVGRGRDGRLRGREPRARREPAVRGRCVGARARDRVGRAVPVAARARLPLPRRAPAVAALAGPRGGCARVGGRDAAAPPAAAGAGRSPRRGAQPARGRCRLRVPRARVLGLLVRPAVLAVRRCAGAARALPGREAASAAARSCGSRTVRCCRRCGSAGCRSRA